MKNKYSPGKCRPQRSHQRRFGGTHRHARPKICAHPRCGSAVHETAFPWCSR